METIHQKINKQKFINFIHLDIRTNPSEDQQFKSLRQCPKMQLLNYKDKTNIKRSGLISYKRRNNNIRQILKNGKI